MNYFNFDPLNSSTSLPTVSRKEYEVFCKEFVFEKLKGKSFGSAFCEKFNIDDYYLTRYSDDTAKYHIEKLGYIR